MNSDCLQRLERVFCLANIRRKTKKNLIKGLILALVFVAALIGYFAWSFINTEKKFTAYTALEEPTLPVLYVETESGREVNVMHAYLQDMGNEAAADCVTVLPQNRKLHVRIAEYGNVIANLSYEIRSLDLSHFIEKTAVTDLESKDGNTEAILPIQNLIEKDTQYLLRIQADIEENTINYYTKIVWTDHDYASGMLDFAENFAEKTFDYNAARELTTFLETNATGKNENLGEVDIQSNFSQLTWGDSGMRRSTDIALSLKQYNGIMGCVEARYMAERTNELEQTERYQVVDTYTLRMGSDRLYLMNYERKTDQLFEGNKHLFSGKQIDLGIASDGMLQAEQSENGQYLVFKADRELWSYDQKNKRAVNIFSFRSGEDDGVRANYAAHDIKILSVEDNGDVDFVVYGYMNRGRHEGWNGLVYYRYNRGGDTITERFFIPMAKSFSKIQAEVQKLCSKGSNDMFYFAQNNALIAIDLKSLEMMALASNLPVDSWAVSSDQTKVAWLDGKADSSSRIKFMDLRSGNTQTIPAAKGEVLCIVGFSNHDLIYGSASANDTWIVGGRKKGLPMQSLKIVSDTLALQKEYARDGLYVADIRIEGNRIHLEQYAKGTAAGSYSHVGSDTIIFREAADAAAGLISSSQSAAKQKVYFVRLSQEVKTTRNLKVSVPRKLSYEDAGNIEIPKRDKRETGQQFYAYGNGRLSGIYTSLQAAVNGCYEALGWVTDENGLLLYNRADRESLKTIDSPESAASGLVRHLDAFTGTELLPEEGLAVLDGQGLSLQQVLYYVYQGIPVAAYYGEQQYYLIYGYDNFNIKLYNPAASEDSQRRLTMGRADAEALFAAAENNFICAIAYQS